MVCHFLKGLQVCHVFSRDGESNAQTQKTPRKKLSQTSQQYLRIYKHFKGLIENTDEIINCIIHPGAMKQVAETHPIHWDPTVMCNP